MPKSTVTILLFLILVTGILFDVSLQTTKVNTIPHPAIGACTIQGAIQMVGEEQDKRCSDNYHTPQIIKDAFGNYTLACK